MMAVTWAGALICLLAGILLGAWATCDVLLGPLRESVDRLQATQTRLVAAWQAQEPHPDLGEVVAVVEPGDPGEIPVRPVMDVDRLRTDSWT